jgi:competence protein ComEC
VLDVAALRKTGAIALDLDDAGRLIVTTASQITGRRPWVENAPVMIAPLE